MRPKTIKTIDIYIYKVYFKVKKRYLKKNKIFYFFFVH